MIKIAYVLPAPSGYYIISTDLTVYIVSGEWFREHQVTTVDMRGRVWLGAGRHFSGRNQLKAKLDPRRAGMMTASIMAPIMSGDAERILRLYRVFIGEAHEENLDRVWRVQLGLRTEKLNLDWYEMTNKVLLTKRNTLVISPLNENFGATLDGWDPNLNCPVECKHVGGREPSEILLDRYQPQLQWQMMVTCSSQCAFSVIKGADEPVVDYVPRHDPYISEMIERAYSFLLCVAMRSPPTEIAPVPTPIDPKLKINMTGNNNWGHAASIWLENRPRAQMFEDAKDIIKSLVPPEAVLAFGHGIMAARSRNGAITIRKEKPDA